MSSGDGRQWPTFMRVPPYHFVVSLLFPSFPFPQPQLPQPSGQPLLTFTITRISQPSRQSTEYTPTPPKAQPTPTLACNTAPPPPSSAMSLSFWVDACNYAFNRPLQTQLDAAHASCGVTVRHAAVRVVALHEVAR